MTQDVYGDITDPKLTINLDISCKYVARDGTLVTFNSFDHKSKYGEKRVFLGDNKLVYNEDGTIYGSETHRQYYHELFDVIV